MAENTEDKGKAPVKRTGSATSIRLSPIGLGLWDQLSAREGLNRTAFLEMTLRRLAAEKNIEPEKGIEIEGRE